jgi:hypothetical protein
VRVLSVSVLVADPAGVSTRVVDVECDFSLVDESGLFASMFTLVEELGGVVGCTTVVEELGALGAGCTTVVEESLGAGAVCWAGSFTTVVEEEGTLRSQPASAAIASAAMGRTISLIEVSIVGGWKP